MEAEATDCQAQAEAKGDNIHTIVGKWQCRQSCCSNNNGICWFERPGAPHWKVLMPEVEKWARQWQNEEDGVDVKNPPFDLIKTPVDQSNRGLSSKLDTPLPQPLSINVHNTTLIPESSTSTATTPRSGNKISALLDWLTPIVSSAINRPLHSPSSIQISDMIAASNQLAAAYPDTDLMRILQARPNSHSHASSTADQTARALSAIQSPTRSITPLAHSISSAQLMSSPQTGVYSGDFTCKAWIKGFKSWIFKRWKDLKKKKDIQQVNEAFDTLIAQWYDYEPLKKATVETWERFNIPSGLDRRI